MANTTNFGWETPDDTDLVKDGAAAMRTLGNAIDTSFVDLKGGTTGQILSKASNTDLDYTWIAANPGDITSVTAGTGLSGGGTSGDVTLTNTVATAYDAKGDLIAGTGADTFSRLAVGTNGYLLTADSTAATGLAWTSVATGGMTLISTTTISGGSSSVTLSSIPSTYNTLYAVLRDVMPNNLTSIRMRFNADSTASRHREKTWRDAPAASAWNDDGVTVQTTSDNSIADNLTVVTIPDYANTATRKMMNSISYVTDSVTNSQFNWNAYFGFYNQTGAISSLSFYPLSGTFASGSILLYGVK